MKHRIVNSLNIVFTLCLGVSISACSSSPSKGAKADGKSKSKLATSTTISDKKIEEYTRQDNNGVSNAHVHPATESSRSFRHVHPNGANKHSHH